KWVLARLPSDRHERTRILESFSKGGPAFTAMPSLYVPWPPAGKEGLSRSMRAVDKQDIESNLWVETSRILDKQKVRPEEAGVYPINARAGSGAVVVRRDNLEVIGVATGHTLLDDLKLTGG